jgi:ABC-2 type transport system permease protein
MLTVLTQAISNASFGIYFPKFVGTIYELLSAPVSFLEVTAGYVLAAATKALVIGLIILGDIVLLRRHRHRASSLDGGLPGADLRVSFALFGFIIGIWAQNFEQLQLVPLAGGHAARCSLAARSTRFQCCRRHGRR